LAGTVLPDFVVIDSEMAGETEHNGVFLLPGSCPVLVDSGVGLAGERVADKLTAYGLAPDDLFGIFVTHVHLDHAGGAGEVARRFPGATVFVHPAGARHLIDPSRLEASARQVNGTLMDTVFGSMTPIEPGRIRTLADGETVDLGSRRLTAIHTPGHAPHHVSVFDETAGTLFTGDSAGVKLPDMRTSRPATPPPSFDAAAARNSLLRMAALSPKQLVLTHFGAVWEPAAYLADLTDRLDRWCAAATTSVAAGEDAAVLEARLLDLFAAEEGLPVNDPARFASTGGYGPNAAGLHLWATKTAAEL
jgi:glyoxylase-like metal-dependent hydrolase (beta-lactamase superfamily II)